MHHRAKHEQAIRSMTDQMSHRGPDAQGIYVDEKVAFGHRRLSIIDLSDAANQPMTDTHERYLLVYNGEIYNFKEIRNQLDGYSFTSESDSEVILASFITWGTKCVDRFNGMFAIAIWDKAEESLFLARDRMGKKPLYYIQTDHHFMFSSEVRSLLASGLLSGKLDEDNLSTFLMYQTTLGEQTLVQDMFRISSGHIGIFKNKKLECFPYWDYSHTKPSKDELDTAKKKIRELFMDSVRLRMVSDVPVGAFLSGGIDSSLVVACMAELSDEPINTFTVSFEESEFDESAFAQQIASKYRTHHHNIVIRQSDFLESVEEIFSAMDVPSGDGPNSYLVAKHTRNAGIKVAMSGLGGDEIFAGYNKFMIYKRMMDSRWMFNLPKGVRYPFIQMLKTFGTNQRYDKLAQMLSIDKAHLSTLYPILRQVYTDEQTQRILRNPGKKDHLERKLEKIGEALPWAEYFSQATLGEMETYTRDVLLRDTDQFSMRHGLEVRVPFFDYRLFSYTLSLPDALKYPDTPKRLLTESFSSQIPKEISQRKKMGFTLPFKKWLRMELADMVNEKINALATRKEFNESEVLRIWEQFKSGSKHVPWPQIWNMTVLSDWIHRNDL